MEKEEFLRRFKWVNPASDYGPLTYRPEINEHNRHYAVRGACHRIVDCMEIVPSKHLEKVDGYDWELFHSSHRGIIEGVEYLWGGFVEGLGFFHVMVPMELARELTAEEREKWSKVTLGMYGFHSGNLSYTMESGVSAE